LHTNDLTRNGGLFVPDHFQQRQRAGNLVAVDACGEIEPRR
jgi:hypothetical protein